MIEDIEENLASFSTSSSGSTSTNSSTNQKKITIISIVGHHVFHGQVDNEMHFNNVCGLTTLINLDKYENSCDATHLRFHDSTISKTEIMGRLERVIQSSDEECKEIWIYFIGHGAISNFQVQKSLKLPSPDGTKEETLNLIFGSGALCLCRTSEYLTNSELFDILKTGIEERKKIKLTLFCCFSWTFVSMVQELNSFYALSSLRKNQSYGSIEMINGPEARSISDAYNGIFKRYRIEKIFGETVKEKNARQNDNSTLLRVIKSTDRNKLLELLTFEHPKVHMHGGLLNWIVLKRKKSDHNEQETSIGMVSIYDSETDIFHRK